MSILIAREAEVSVEQLSNYSVWINFAIFFAVSVVIWLAGTQLQGTADAIALRTGIQRAFVGVLMLSVATSLPETASVIGAVRTGDADLAVHALMGATITQMSLLVVADIVACRRGALTHLSPRFLILFQGVGLVLLLVVAMAGMSAGPIVTVWRLDLWAVMIAVTYGAVIYWIYRMQTGDRWQPVGEYSKLLSEGEDGGVCIIEDLQAEQEEMCRFKAWKLRWIVMLFVAMAVVVLAAGLSAALVAEVLAVQTGLGASFIGVTLLAFATSTPELAIVIASARQGAYSLAFSNIFGTNMYNVFLLVVAELFYAGGFIFQGVHRSAIFAAAMAAMIVCVYLWGLLEHENRTILRLGWDSAAVLVLFLGGYYVLYLLR